MERSQASAMLRLASLVLLAAPATPLLMLSQAPTPLLLVDLDALLAVDLEDIGAMSCAERSDLLSDALFVHARVTSTRDATTSSGVWIDSDLLFVGLLAEDDDDVETACASGIVCVGWTTEPCVVGRFELRRKVAS